MKRSGQIFHVYGEGDREAVEGGVNPRRRTKPTPPSVGAARCHLPVNGEDLPMPTREHFRLSGFHDDSPVIEVDAIIDPNQPELTIPRWMSDRLNLRKCGTKFRHNGIGEPCDYVGAVRIEGRNSETCSGALVAGDQVVMGWLPLSSLVNEVRMAGVYSHREVAG